MFYNAHPSVPPPSPPRTMLQQQQPVHDPNAPFSRMHHPVLGPQHPHPLSHPHAQPPHGPHPPPQSPGYGLVYANGTAHHQHRHSLNSISHPHPSFSSHSPATAHTQATGLRQETPPGNPNQIISSIHWQQQILKAELCRQAASPHHRARASALASRNTAKSAIPITDPNRPKPVENGNSPSLASRDGTASEHTDDSEEGRPSNSANGHPSSTVAPVITAPAGPRPSAVRKINSSWTTLDMGGMRLKNLSKAVFNLTYLTTLYINHNQLTHLPPDIAQLRNLILLDLSGNQLSEVPAELGMCTSLRELYLFDNHIQTLPPEFGNLHQLELLGVEGNPMQASLRAIIQKDGTQALISYLRDSCPVPMPPPERAWKLLLTDAERAQQESDPNAETFSLLCYNILCEKYATSHMYGYTPAWALAWEYRKELILTEIMNYESDFLCLQEVDVAQYEDYFMHHLSANDYEGVYWPKSRARTMGDSERRRVDGCAIFFKSSKYQLVEKQLLEFNQLALQRPDFQKTEDMFNRVFTKDNIAVVALLENRHTGSRLIVANVHIHWDPEYRDVKLVQTGLLMDQLSEIADRFSRLPPRLHDENDPDSLGRPPPPSYSDGTQIPTIVCGDFNSVPDSGVYEFMSTGSVPSTHPDFTPYVYGNYTSNGLKHPLALRSAYSSVGELPITNYTPSFEGAIDYIWYTTNTLGVNAVLGEVDAGYLSKVVGFPNAHFPSDHICIMSEFRVKHQKDSSAQSAVVRKPPVFTNNSRTR